MMLVRQCRDTFIRRFGDIGYITNQLTKHDRVYDDVGAVFLDQISRAPKSVSHIVDTLHPLFIGVDKELLHQDLVEFLNDLEGDKFLVTGESECELDRKEPSFSYQVANPKTITFNFAQQDRDRVYPDTSDFFYQYFNDIPTIFSLQMEVTSRCNERCIHCYIPHAEKTDDMMPSLATSIIDQAAAMGTVSLSLSGGELFLHPRIGEILTHARRNDFMITILSNATLLDHELCRLLKEININFIQVSLYSMDPTEHDAITQVNGSHTKTLKSIERLLELDIPVQISCPVMKLNLGSYRDVLTWAYRHKIKAYTDFIMMARTDFSTDNLDHRLNLCETETLIRDIIEVDEMYTSILDQEPPSANIEDYADQPVCGVGVDNICVTADGYFYPCSGFQGYPLGNAYQQTLREVWGSSERIQFLRGITKGSFPRCMRCEARDYCAMCLVRNFNESGGDMFSINEHFCKVAFINKRLVEEYRRNKQVQTA